MAYRKKLTRVPDEIPDMNGDIPAVMFYAVRGEPARPATRLTETQRTQLSSHLPPRMARAARVEFLDAVNWAVMVWESKLSWTVSNDEMRKRLEDAAAAARALRKAIYDMRGDTYQVHRVLRKTTDKPDTKKLSELWSVLREWEVDCAHTAEGICPSKGDRLDFSKTRALVGEIIVAHKVTFNRLPRGSWFVDFCGALAGSLGVYRPGKEIVKEALRTTRLPCGEKRTPWASMPFRARYSQAPVGAQR